MTSIDDEPWLRLLFSASRTGQYVKGYVDGTESKDELLKAFFATTHSSFAVRRSVQSRQAETSHRDILCQLKQGNTPMHFDGVPFAGGPAVNPTIVSMDLTAAINGTQLDHLTSSKIPNLGRATENCSIRRRWDAMTTSWLRTSLSGVLAGPCLL